MELHIGREIEEKYNESGLKLSEFAKRLNTGERNVYSIFKRKSVDSDLLQTIGEALNFDFFSLYQDRYKNKDLKPLSGEPSFDLAKRIQVTIELDGKLETLKDWIDTLKKLNAALA